MASPQSIPNPANHPARYSGAVIDRFIKLIGSYEADLAEVTTLFDPFAGTGERLAELQATGYQVSGIELQRSLIVNRSIVKQGDATRAKRYPGVPYAIVTSPVYPNGVADSHRANDTSKRFTYTVANRLNGGGDELHPNNMGRYGYRGTKRGGRSERRAAYWRLARQAVDIWTGDPNCRMVFLNVSDFLSGSEVEPLTADWRSLLREFGWKIDKTVKVATPRNRGNANSEQRVDHEAIIVAKRR